MEAIIEGIISCQRALSVLLVGGGHFSSAVVHLPHLLQPLPADDVTGQLALTGSRTIKYISSNGWRAEMSVL